MDMTIAASLSQSMDRAVKHYSSLFIIPSYKKVLLLLALTSICGGLLPSAILFPFPEGAVNGLLLGFSLFFANLIIDYMVSLVILKRDPIYGLRRIAALSFFSWVLWIFFIVLGAIVAMFFDSSWWIRLSLLGFSAVIILRSIVLLSTSSTDYKRLFTASLLQPFSCTILFLVFWSWTNKEYQIAPTIIFIILSPILGFLSSLLFISILNRVGMQTLGVPSLPLFKTFLLNWIVGLNVPFEEFLEKLGENQNVEVSLMKFDSSNPKAVIVVPSVHPGPFKNVGSSLLPSMLKTALETKLDCVVCVPHGLLGHEFDLASQVQNQKIINRVVEFANLEVSVTEATPFIKVSNGLATACCQAFGNFAFLSFTLAPKTTEDLPQELGVFVRQEAERHKLTCCVVVNAHNSIDGTTKMQEALDALKTVAATCLEKAVSLKQLPFEVGAATVIPKEFSLKEGMGPGGITVVVVKVGGQKTAYVVIDGNNMVSGLREKILSALHLIGIDEGEVFTTDTHSVNAIILNNRGYHPIGEAIDQENLIGYIKRATSVALSRLEHVKAACRSITIPEIKVIGEKRLETLCLLIDRALQKAKKIVVPIFATSGLFLMLILMLI
jgi:putative membrane protein